MNAMHTSRRLRRGAGTAGLALTVAVLAGCGDNTGANPGSTPAPTTASSTASTSSSPTGGPVDPPSDLPSTTTTTEPTTAPDPAPTTTPKPSNTANTPAGGAGTPVILPAGAAPYADALVIAWGSGDRDAALQYATPEVVTTLFGEHSPGGPHWDQVGVEGAAGTIFVTYQDTVTHQMLVVGVQNEASSRGSAHAAYRASFEQ